MSQLHRTVALIVAAGAGSRLGGVPKQYQLLGGKALLLHSVETFERCAEIDAVYVVVAADHAPYFVDMIGDRALPTLVHGGATRQQSVLAGLQQIATDGGCARVLIHDAARPFVRDKVILAALAALDTADGAAPALAITDSLRLAAGHTCEVSGDVSRDGVYRVQTPQCFQFEAIRAAHAVSAARDASDDIAVARAAGLTVVLTPGDELNFKITMADDMARAERHLATAKISRVGTGYDVHSFGPGDHVWLCGIRIAHSHGIIAHSDGDAGLHALTDALLGTIGAGDIGSHFPPTDEQWKDAASHQFLRHAAGLVRARGGVIDHADVTLVCESPKIGPHRDAMRACVAEILALDVDCVSIKATTTEGLGFTGRREGIAAIATVSVRR